MIGPSRQKKQCTPHYFFPPYRWGERVYPPLYFPHLTDGEKQCTPHYFSPPYRWGERVNYTLFPLQYGGNLIVYPPTLFSHCNKMEKKSVPPTLFFPIIEGEKVQRVRNYPYPM